MTKQQIFFIQKVLQDKFYNPGKVDGIFGPRTKAAVMRFQKHNNLIVDGIVGPITMTALERVANKKTEAFGQNEMLKLVRVPVDKYGNGYSNFSLRSDVVGDFNRAYKELKAAGAMVTSSGSIRSLNAVVISAGRSATSLHYLAVAFDLHIYSAVVGNGNHPYVVEMVEQMGSEDEFTVWARCNEDCADRSEITGVHRDAGGMFGKKKYEGSFINLTRTFKKYNFVNIPARGSDWKRRYINMEWWHFQYALEQGITFGEELLKLYPLSTLEKTLPWRYKDYVFVGKSFRG